jgi:hypothetical protein
MGLANIWAIFFPNPHLATLIVDVRWIIGPDPRSTVNDQNGLSQQSAFQVDSVCL